MGAVQSGQFSAADFSYPGPDQARNRYLCQARGRPFPDSLLRQ
ncbi:hypothetical protein Hsw_2396 [Hymenobacter swuensis DY53]|uniref:Uncharacterized protein n=1 Tax=Hymenobacter swuensis DY53 TaxID=1227739 RepID=W8F5X4_9BACT|nr:hypothetical protein Hsw_2396 [Hymenobacter swuensis DY53]